VRWRNRWGGSADPRSDRLRLVGLDHAGPGAAGSASVPRRGGPESSRRRPGRADDTAEIARLGRPPRRPERHRRQRSYQGRGADGGDRGGPGRAARNAVSSCTAGCSNQTGIPAEKLTGRRWFGAERPSGGAFNLHGMRKATSAMGPAAAGPADAAGRGGANTTGLPAGSSECGPRAVPLPRRRWRSRSTDGGVAYRVIPPGPANGCRPGPRASPALAPHCRSVLEPAGSAAGAMICSERARSAVDNRAVVDHRFRPRRRRRTGRAGPKDHGPPETPGLRPNDQGVPSVQRRTAAEQGR